MAFVRVQSLARLSPGSIVEVRVDRHPVALCNVEGVVYAIDGVCPHAAGPLGHGALHGHMVVCPYHAWEFDCRTGENDFDPAIKVETYAVRIEGDSILVDLERRAGTA